jgi:hypothetical protein
VLYHPNDDDDAITPHAVLVLVILVQYKTRRYSCRSFLQESMCGWLSSVSRFPMLVVVAIGGGCFSFFREMGDLCKQTLEIFRMP